MFFAAPAFGAEITATFTGADNDPLSASWDGGYLYCADVQILGNKAANSLADNLSCATWNANSFANDQFGEVTLGNFSSVANCEAAVILRASNTPDMVMFAFRAMLNEQFGVTSKIFVFDTLANGHDLITSSSETWAAGDKLRGVVSGTTLSLYRNNVLVISCDYTTDCAETGLSVNAAGKVGLWVSTSTAGAFSDCTIQSYRGGDGDGSTPPTTVVRHKPIVMQ